MLPRQQRTCQLRSDADLRAAFPGCPLDPARIVRGWGHCLGHVATVVVIAAGCFAGAAFQAAVLTAAPGFAWDEVITAARSGRKADGRPQPGGAADAARVTNKRPKTTLSTKDAKILFSSSRKKWRELLRLVPRRWQNVCRRVRRLMRSYSQTAAEVRAALVSIHTVIHREGYSFLWTEGPHHAVHTAEFAERYANGLRGVLDERVESSNQTVDGLLGCENGSVPDVMARESGRVHALHEQEQAAASRDGK